MAKRNLAELKIPAASAYIPVAKRVATTLGGQLGLSLMDLDELAIALTQACDSAIAAADDLGTPADLKLTYFATNRALVVDVDLMPTGVALPLPRHETHITISSTSSRASFRTAASRSTTSSRSAISA